MAGHVSGVSQRVQRRTPTNSFVTGAADAVASVRIGSDGRGAQPEFVDRLCSLALRGVALAYQPEQREVAFTRRAVSPRDRRAAAEGSSVRYTAMVALGLRRVPETEQRRALAGLSARELASSLVDRLPLTTDFGDLAVVCWAAAETGATNAEGALTRLLAALRTEAPLPTVHAAWALTALVASRRWSAAEAPARRLRDRLLASRQPGRALFGHATEGGRFVGCFADQVYPIQALARFAQACGDAAALAAADGCADRICDLQGPGGQWWWHYDSRTDRVLEGYPVYSVHQHAMAPMALRDLRAAGGKDHAGAVALGLAWLQSPPERSVELIDDDQAVVWRKIARREYPNKSVRGVKAVVRRFLPNAGFSVLDRIAPPVIVDWECRPYELGWLLYAWTAEPGVPDGDLTR